MVNCSNCGMDVGDSKFCPNCGTCVEVEEINHICPNCGYDAEGTAFCPECGTKIADKKPNKFCPNCGESLTNDVKFCPYCGWSKSQDNSAASDSDSFDKIIDIDDKVSSKFSNVLGKSKSMDKIFDKTASIGYKRIGEDINSTDRKYYEKIEPVFLEVLDSIEDNFVKAILFHERSVLSSGGSVVGLVAAQIYTPTKDLSHDEAKKFYQNMVNDIVDEINREKQKGTFDEEEFYKKRVKNQTLNNMSVLGVPKSVKSWKNNQR